MKHILNERSGYNDLSIVEEVLILEAAFKRAGQVYDWYIADEIFNKYDVLVMDDRALDILVMYTLQQYGVWDDEAYQAEITKE